MSIINSEIHHVVSIEVEKPESRFSSDKENAYAVRNIIIKTRNGTEYKITAFGSCQADLRNNKK